MAHEHLCGGDAVAALSLARWAVATIDTRRHSLVYQKPKLHRRLQRLQAACLRQLGQMAAYLPLLPVKTPTKSMDALDLSASMASKSLKRAQSVLAFSVSLFDANDACAVHIDQDCFALVACNLDLDSTVWKTAGNRKIILHY